MQRSNDTNLLRPEFRQTLLVLEERLISAGSRLRIFECYRHPARQDSLYTQGASKARAWHSAHQYGLAADFAGYYADEQHWTWDLPETMWDQLTHFANDLRLSRPISWDKGHIEHPNTWTWVKRPK